MSSVSLREGYTTNPGLHWQLVAIRRSFGRYHVNVQTHPSFTPAAEKFLSTFETSFWWYTLHSCEQFSGVNLKKLEILAQKHEGLMIKIIPHLWNRSSRSNSMTAQGP